MKFSKNSFMFDKSGFTEENKMIEHFKKNNTVLCVDDDVDILTVYTTGLADSEEENAADKLFSRRKARGLNHSKTVKPDFETGNPGFNVLTASSGEQAVEIVENEIKKGRKIAAGFFDMNMPGGIDGLETIKRIKKLDTDILCAVVTAYTEKTVSQIGMLFNNKDEWIYFNKPFSMQELEQAAIHLVSSWNRRRRENHHLAVIEKSRIGLYHILKAIIKLTKLPPAAIHILMPGIIEQTAGLVGAESAFMYIFGGSGEIMFCHGTGIYESVTNEQLTDFVSVNPIIEESIDNKKIVYNESYSSLPLIIADRVIGIIFFRNSPDFHPFINLLELFKMELANIIENSMLYDELSKTNDLLKKQKAEVMETMEKLSIAREINQELETKGYTDELTNLRNRRYLMERLREDFSAAVRFEFPLSCLIIDLDGFKEINDQYGHSAGDAVLKHIGIIFSKNKRFSDVVGRIKTEDEQGDYVVTRYGGDEFVFLARRTSAENAAIIAERLRSEVEKYEFPVPGGACRLTLSIGVATFFDNNFDKPIDLLNRVDQALYKAKEEGRNRVEVL